MSTITEAGVGVAARIGGLDAELLELLRGFREAQDPEHRHRLLASMYRHLGLPDITNLPDPLENDAATEFDVSDYEMDDVDSDDDDDDEEEEAGEVSRLAEFDWDGGSSRADQVLTEEELRERRLGWEREREAAIEKSLTAVDDREVRGVDGEALECCVCLEEICAGLKRTPCRHSFHGDCIRHWLKVGGGSCPACRFPILPPNSSSH